MSLVQTAAAKSLQSCPTLCDPIDGSSPGSLVPGILQARTVEWLPFPSPMHESEKWKWSHSVVSNSSRPHGLQPTRLLHPWDFPGKSSGVGCHCLLLIQTTLNLKEGDGKAAEFCFPIMFLLNFPMFSFPPFSGWASSYSVSTRFLWNPCALGHQPIVWWRGKSLQSCSTHCDPIDCSLQGSSVHGIFSGKSSGVGGSFFLQGIFQIQGSHPHLLSLLHCQAGSLPIAPSRKTPSPDGVILKPWMWWINTPFFVVVVK